MVAATLARTAGWRTVVGETNDPRRSRVVVAARAAIMLQHS